MKRLFLVCLALLSVSPAVYAVTATFDDLGATIPYTGPGGGSYENGQNLTPIGTTTDPWGATVNLNTFASGSAIFTNNYIPAYPSWEGWSYSNTTDTATTGFDNQYSAVTGGARSGSQYGVFFEPSGDPTPTIRFGGPVNLTDAFLTNTTYAHNAVVEGDVPFVKGPFQQGDFFKVTVRGHDATGAPMNSLDVFLADYRSSDSGDWYALDNWTQIDLSLLGTVNALSFDLDSSDVGTFGMNTPAYFAMDDLGFSAVPIPGAVWLFATGMLGLIGWSRSRRSPLHRSA